MNETIKTLLPMLRRFAYSLTGSKADADDVVQITIEKLLVKGIPDDVEPAKWAFKICRNVWIDEYRSRKVRQNTAQADILPEPITSNEHQTLENKQTLVDSCERSIILPGKWIFLLLCGRSHPYYQ